MPQLETCGFPARQTAFERQDYFYPYIKLRMRKKNCVRYERSFVRNSGIEPETPSVSCLYSNQLS